MPNITTPTAGLFCWPELFTPDQPDAREFYTNLFGWETREIPMGPGAVYIVFTLNGRDAAACYGAPPESIARQAPAHWMSYVYVANADESAAKARAAGGVVVKEPFDVPATGRMAVLQDPTGATFCVWQGTRKHGVQVVQEPGALQWTELLASDTEASAAFYETVFGWKRTLWPSPENPAYHLFMNGDAMAGGMTPITREMLTTKPVWCVYFNVADCDDTIARGVKLGGKLVMPAETVPEVGRFAGLSDPTGAHFGILTPVPKP
jgi:predicted enzyme related to lactoylglutathione lyase